MSATLTPRWYPLRPHEKQQALYHADNRFCVVPAGRRSGKTEVVKRKVARAAMRGTRFPDGRFFLGAPTRDQAKRIFWKDLKLLIPPWARSGTPSESELVVRLKIGTEVHVIGMDKPERIEGTPWDGGGLDEYANMKEHAWPENVRPALSDRKGWCVLSGVPEGRNHYYEVTQKAKADKSKTWRVFTWPSADILDAEEIEAARRDLDPLTFDQEYNASFVNFEGRCYYPFDDTIHATDRLKYDIRGDLIFTFDFNVSPGTASVLQEQRLPGQYERNAKGMPLLDRPIYGTGIIGEVYIPRNSSTPAVCERLIKDWGHHQGKIFIYGDATGGADGTAKVKGSDWDLIQMAMFKHFGAHRVFMCQGTSNPRERVRVNAVNTRLLNGAKEIHMMVDRQKCPHIIKDFDGVTLLKGGSGEIDKKATPLLTHLTDGIGYYIAKVFPINKQDANGVELVGA